MTLLETFQISGGIETDAIHFSLILMKYRGADKSLARPEEI